MRCLTLHKNIILKVSERCLVKPVTGFFFRIIAKKTIASDLQDKWNFFLLPSTILSYHIPPPRRKSAYGRTVTNADITARVMNMNLLSIFFLLSSVLQVVNYKWVDGDDCFTRGELLRCPLYSRYIPRSYSLPIFFSLHLPLFVKIEFPILHYAKLDFLCGGNITLIESDQTEWGASLLSYI